MSNFHGRKMSSTMGHLEMEYLFCIHLSNSTPSNDSKSIRLEVPFCWGVEVAIKEKGFPLRKDYVSRHKHKN